MEYEGEEDFIEEVTPPQRRRSPRENGGGALSVFDTRGLEHLLPSSIRGDPKMPASPVDPNRKWLAFSAGMLDGNTLGSGLSNALKGYQAQEAKDAELLQRYLGVAEQTKARHAAAMMAQDKQRQAMLAGWSQALVRGVAPLLGEPAISPQMFQQTVAGLVNTGQVPKEVAERFISSVPQEPEALRGYLTRMAVSASDPFRALKAPTLKAVGPDSTLVSVSPDGKTATPLATGAPKKDPFERLLEANGVQRGSPEWKAAMAQRILMQSTHPPRTQVSVVNKTETAEAMAVGKGFGESFNEFMGDAKKARSELGTITRMSSLLRNTPTGKLTPILTDLAGYAESLGLKVDPKLGEKEVIRSLSSQMALSARSTGEGAGMPGAMSDADRNFLVKMVPGLANSPRANEILLETMRRIAQRRIETARLAARYRQERGTFNSGDFLSYAEDYFKDKNMFDDFTGRKPAASSRSEDDLVKGAGVK